jgi:hypothetical protein
MSGNYYLSNAISKKFTNANSQAKDENNHNTGNNEYHKNSNDAGNLVDNNKSNNNSKNTENNGEFKDFSLPQDILDKMYDIKHYPAGYLERLIKYHQQSANPININQNYNSNDIGTKKEGGLAIYTSNPKRPI